MWGFPSALRNVLWPLGALEISRLLSHKAVFWPEEFLFHQVTFGLCAGRREAEADVGRHKLPLNVSKFRVG